MMTFSSARRPIRFSSLGAGRTVRESDMGNLGNMLDRSTTLQHAASIHLKLGRTAKVGQTHLRMALAKTVEPALHDDTRRLYWSLGYGSPPDFEQYGIEEVIIA